MVIYFLSKSNLKVLYTLTLLICDGDFVQACVLT